MVSGPSATGVGWAQAALFAMHTDPDQAPVARFSSSCSQLTCSFDGTGSSDKEGPVTYSWDFGDGHTSTAAQPQNVFSGPGTYHVTLNVTDSAGQTNAVSHDVVVSSAVGVTYVDSAISAQTGSVANHSFTVPATVKAGDTMVMYFTDNAPAATVTAPAGWTQVGTQSTGGSLTRVWSRTATAGDIGSTVTVSMSAAGRGLLGMSDYRGAAGVTAADVTMAAETASRAAHTTPTSPLSGSSTWVLSLWTDKTAATTTWTAPGGQVVRNLKAETGSGHTSLLATDDGQPALSGTAGGLTATADSATASAAMATIEIRPAGQVVDGPPVASFSSSCTQLTCSFDGTGSSDTEGPVTYAWDFGDGHSSTAAQPQNAFAAAGTYHVTLTVTDSAGQTNAVTHDVVVSSAAGVSYVDSAISAQTGSVVNHSFTVPTTVHVGDALVMYFTDNAPAATVTAPAGWTQVGTQSTGGILTRVWSRTATAGDIGSNVTVSMSAAGRGLLGMSAYRDAAGVTAGDVTMAAETVNRAAHTTPTSPLAGSSTWVLSLWTDKTAATTTWSTPAGQAVRNLKAETGTGHTSLLATDGNGPAPAGTAGGVTATADSSTANAVMATVEIRSAG